MYIYIYIILTRYCYIIITITITLEFANTGPWHHLQKADLASSGANPPPGDPRVLPFEVFPYRLPQGNRPTHTTCRRGT